MFDIIRNVSQYVHQGRGLAAGQKASQVSGQQQVLNVGDENQQAISSPWHTIVLHVKLMLYSDAHNLSLQWRHTYVSLRLCFPIRGRVRACTHACAYATRRLLVWQA